MGRSDRVRQDRAFRGICAEPFGIWDRAERGIDRGISEDVLPLVQLGGEATLDGDQCRILVRIEQLEGKKMKPLSESLMDLAARVKQFEESSAAAKEKNRAALQAQQKELGATLERERDEFGKTTADLREAAQSWWSDTREALEHQIDVMQADFDKWQADIKAQRAARTADAGKTTEPTTEP